MLVAAQEVERKRLARELHDVLGQALTAVRLSLQAIEAAQPPGERPNPVLRASMATVEAAMGQVRALAFELRPSVLDDLGLAASARAYCRRIAEGSGLRIAVHARGLQHRVAAEIETTAYRILQEALTNVVLHAGATRVRVSIAACAATSTLVLDVRDDGVGFAASLEHDPSAVGILGMRERAALVGGTCEIRSSRGIGTRVRVQLPIGEAHVAGVA